MTSLSINPAKTQLKEKSGPYHPDLDYNINRGIFALPSDGFLASSTACLLTANYFIKHLSMALFVYLSTTLAGLNPTDTQTPLCRALSEYIGLV